MKLVVSAFGRAFPVAAILSIATLAPAQTPPSGDVSVTADFLPSHHDAAELRARVFAEEVLDPTPRLTITLSGFAEGLLARRPLPPSFEPASRTGAILRVEDANVDYRGRRVDLLAGYTRVVWGRLDELQPTDVINPLDVSKFFFEGRSAARLPVALVRARGHISENAAIEAVYVPFFRRGRFDQLDEGSSPFNVETSFPASPPVCLALGCPGPLPYVPRRLEPSRSLRNSQGGARLNATSGRVDWSVSAYRGIEPFGLGAIALPGTASTPAIEELRALGLLPPLSFVPVDIVYPRFTMVGGDFETVRGQWGLRGEVAAFVDDNFEDPSLRVLKGQSVDAGVGLDRKAGDYRISGGALLHREIYDRPSGAADGRTDISLIGSADRTFARERYHLRSFGVYNPNESSGFARAIATAKIQDNLAVEGSVGWFLGEGRDVVGRFGDSDFIYARLRYYF